MKKISIAEVATEAGVSTTTVSRVINGIDTVSEDNRRRVQEAIKKLKYRPNRSAQQLAAGRTNTIGIIIPRYEGIFHSYYALQVIQGIGMAAEEKHCDLLLNITDGKSLPSGVDGLLFVDIYSCEDLLDQAIDQGLPLVVLNHFLEDLPVNCVAIDNETAAHAVVEFLVNLGHREIATITGDLKTQAGLDRYNGFVKALSMHELPSREDYIKFADFGLPMARKVAEELMDMPDRPTAIFVASDDMALEVLQVAQSKGIRVPEELSVIGFDDNPVAQHSRVPLTTVRQPLSKMGQLALETLLQQMDGKKQSPSKILLPTEVVERSSCRRTWLEH